MSNDYSDLTDMVSDIIRAYIDEDSFSEELAGALVDLDAWHTEDIVMMQLIFTQALELRNDDVDLERQRELVAREMQEDDLHTLSEYLDCGEEPLGPKDLRADLEAEYDDPLFVG